MIQGNGTGCSRRLHRGFTLIELMIVIAIISLLVTLAVPAYKDFTIKAKVTECLNLAAVPKIMISEFRSTLGRWPTNVDEAGIDQGASVISNGLSEYCYIFYYNTNEGDFAVQVDVDSVDPTLSGLNIIPVLSPVVNAQNGVDWFCTRGFTSNEALRYLPATCRANNIF